MTPPARWPAALLLALLTTLAPARAADMAAQPPAPPPPDTLAQRLVACSACHGREGRASREGYLPRIAGKPAAYLYDQLLALRSGRRQNAAMRHLLQPLSDGYLREIAEHFAALDLPYPPPGPAQADAATLRRGEALAQQGDAARDIPACTACHGDTLMGDRRHVPGLLGMPSNYLSGQLGAWKVGQRRAREPDCMARIAARLDGPDISALAAWLATLPVPDHAGSPPSPPPSPPPSRGKAALRCGGDE
ncbi:c-type cytochrome [Leptothrix sp. BB-4]